MSRDQFAYEKFILELNKYKSRPGMTASKMLQALDCSGIRSEGFLSEVMNGKKKANAAMVFAFENLIAEENKAIGKPVMPDYQTDFDDSAKLSEEQKEILSLWMDIDETDQPIIKALMTKFAGRQSK